jgi:transcriptional regulator with PAS, ATPase and Fis domain
MRWTAAGLLRVLDEKRVMRIGAISTYLSISV